MYYERNNRIRSSKGEPLNYEHGRKSTITYVLIFILKDLQKIMASLLLFGFLCYKVGSGSIWMYNFHYEYQKCLLTSTGVYFNTKHNKKNHHICADIYPSTKNFSREKTFLLLVGFMCYKVGNGSIWTCTFISEHHNCRRASKSGILKTKNGQNKYHHICADISHSTNLQKSIASNL